MTDEERSRNFAITVIREVGVRARCFKPRGCDEGNWAIRGSVAPEELECVKKLRGAKQ